MLKAPPATAEPERLTCGSCTIALDPPQVARIYQRGLVTLSVHLSEPNWRDHLLRWHAQTCPINGNPAK